MFAYKKIFKSKKFKAIIIGACLFTILFVICASALAALELNYPEVPGIGAINEKTIQDKGIGFYAKYIVQMVFFITAGVCLAVVLLGGFFYIAANQKPAIVQQGQDMIKRGFLGMFIVVTSYLVLNTINPQLLTFNTVIERLTPFSSSREFPSPKATLVVRGISVAGIPEEVVAKMEKKVFVNKSTGVIVPNPQTEPDKEEVFFVETPFLVAKKLVAQAQEESHIVAELLKYCKCGQSFIYAQKVSDLKIKCAAGKDPEEARQSLDDWIAQDTGLYTKEQAVCLTRADDCGTKTGVIGQDPVPADQDPDPLLNVTGAKVCDLREVINVNSGKKDTVTGELLDPKYEVETTPGGGRVALNSLSPEEQKGLIKLHREKLQNIASMLSPEKMKLSVEQMGILENKLNTEAVKYLASNVEGPFFQSEFEDFMASEKARGVVFDVQVPEQFAVDQNIISLAPPTNFNIFLPQNKNFFSLIKNSAKGLAFNFLKPQIARAQITGGLHPSPDQTTIWYIVEAKNYQAAAVTLERNLKINSEVDFEARRANLFSVLAEMSLEEIDRIFKGCLTAAFGQADYEFRGNMQEIIRDAIQQGTADYVILTLSGASADFANMVGEEVIKEINAQADNHLKAKCAANDCGCTHMCVDDDVWFEDWLAQSEVRRACVDKCVKANIPPHFISNQLAKIATEPLFKRLPSEIQLIFNKELRQVILSPEFNAILDTDMLGLYSQILGVSLEKSFSEMIPFIKKSLNTKTEDFLKKQMPNVVGALHKFLGLQIENLRPMINQRAQDVGKYINAKVEAGVANNLEKFKATMPSIFSENKSWQDCTADWKDGYFFFQEGLAGYCAMSDCPGNIHPDICREEIPKGKCRKLTPQELMLGVGEQTCKKVDSSAIVVGQYSREPAAQEIVCENAHYCWGTDWVMDNIWEGMKKGDAGCGECQWLQVGRVAELGDLDTYAQIGRAGLRGLIDFTAEFAVALTETFLHTAVAFVEVLLEDEIFTPAEPYLKQVINLQDTLSSFLDSTLSNLLPPQLTSILNGNLENALANICSLKTNDPTIKLYPEKTWGGSFSIDVNNDAVAIDKVCHFSNHLNTTLLNEIKADGGKSVVEILQTKTADLILCGEISTGVQPKDCPIRDALNKTPAQLMFEQWGIPNIQDIITGTPRKILCGELNMVKDGATYKKPKEICDTIKEEKVKLLGSIPYISEAKMDLKRFTDNEKKVYRIYCPFVWAACSSEYINTSAVPSGKLGDMAAGFIEQSCARAEVGARTAGCLVGVCRGIFPDLIDPLMQNDPNCPTTNQDQCRACNFSTKPIIEQMIIGAFNANPAIGTVSQRDADVTGARKEKELTTYENLHISYPVITEDLRKVAMSRGITQAEWSQILRKQRSLNEINNIENIFDTGSVLRILISACTSQTKWSDLLVKIPFGVVKPFVEGDATLLLDRGKGEDKNFLNHSAKDLIITYVCGKVKKDFGDKYKNGTFEAIKQREFGDQKKALPYSMESLERPVTAKILEEILESQADDADKISYVACMSLEFAPYEILGLDQKLIYYLRPTEYQILFNLMKDQLSSEERPDALNKVLDILYGVNPVGGLNSAISATTWFNTLPLNDSEVLPGAPLSEKLLTQEKIKLLFDILTTKLKDMPAKGQPAELSYTYGSDIPLAEGNLWTDTLITILSRKFLFLDKTVCDGLRDFSILPLLRKTPLEILKENLKTPIPPIPQVPTLMDVLEKYVPAIGEPYMDSIGEQLGLTDNAYQLFENTGNIKNSVDKWAKKGQAVIQDATDKAFMEAPAALVRIIGDKLSSIFPSKLGADIGGKTGGVCRVITNDSECQTDKGEIIRTKEGKKECCDMGQPTACAPQCRLVSPDEACNVLNGEERKMGENIGGTAGQGYCCFDNKCNLCRPIPADIQTNFCKRQGESQDSRGLCCKERTIQPTQNTINVANSCCTSVIECVTSKFLNHMDLLKDYIVNGPPPF